MALPCAQSFGILPRLTRRDADCVGLSQAHTHCSATTERLLARGVHFHA